MVIVLSHADGLRAGDPVLCDQKKEGSVADVSPVADHVEARVKFDGTYRPSQASIFQLRRQDDGSRTIEVVDKNPAGPKFGHGEKAPVRLPPETVEDGLWMENK